MPSPPVPSSLIPCVSTASLLVLSHPEIHLRKRSAVLKRILEKDSAVIVVQTENPKFGPLIEKATEIIDLWDDCRGWDSGGGGTVPGRVAHVQCRISSAATKATAPATVLFHSLSSLLLHGENTPVAVARMVNNCMGCAGVGRVVAVMEDEEKLKSLRNLFQTELLLKPAADGGLIRVVCRHRPTAGKPSAKSESLEVSKDGEVTVVAAKVKVAAAAEMGKDAAETDAMMSKLTTFSLQLSKEEKRARSEVVMPFWKEEQKAAAAVAAAGGEVEEEEDAVRITSKRAATESRGKIYYEPDDADDWDEEDPDDDLDF